MDVSGKVVVVTGASSGIGAATARATAEAADSCSPRGTRAPGAAGPYLPEAAVVPTDMRNTGKIRRLVDEAVEKYCRIDELVNFLCSPQGGWINGQLIKSNGRYT